MGRTQSNKKTEAVLKLIKQCMIKEGLSEAVSLMEVYV